MFRAQARATWDEVGLLLLWKWSLVVRRISLQFVGRGSVECCRRGGLHSCALLVRLLLARLDRGCRRALSLVPGRS